MELANKKLDRFLKSDRGDNWTDSANKYFGGRKRIVIEEQKLS